MGRPVAEAILAEPDRWDLSSLAAVSNGAAPLSEGVREEIRRALPGRFILDSYGSSESGTTAIPDRRRLRGTRRSAEVRRRRRRRGVRRGDEAVPAGCRRDARPHRADPAGLLQGPGEDRRDVQGGRRRPLVDPRRLRPPRGGRQRDRPRPRLGVHQHRWREGAPRGGRGGAAPPRRRLRRGRGRHAARALGPAGDRAGAAPRRLGGDRGRPARARPVADLQLQGAQADRLRAAGAAHPGQQGRLPGEHRAGAQAAPAYLSARPSRAGWRRPRGRRSLRRPRRARRSCRSRWPGRPARSLERRRRGARRRC